MINEQKILALIPARMGSSRFPGKPMANIMDKPMIGHVYDNVKKNQLLLEIAVATCDEEIYNYITDDIYSLFWDSGNRTWGFIR